MPTLYRHSGIQTCQECLDRIALTAVNEEHRQQVLAEMDAQYEIAGGRCSACLRWIGDVRDLAREVQFRVGDDGSGDIRLIVDQAVKDDALATVEDIADIVGRARDDALASREED